MNAQRTASTTFRALILDPIFTSRQFLAERVRSGPTSLGSLRQPATSLPSSGLLRQVMDQRELSIQSHVTYGYVGGKAAVFPLQCLGYDVDVSSLNSAHRQGSYVDLNIRSLTPLTFPTTQV